MVVDYKYNYLDDIHSSLSLISTPIYQVSSTARDLSDRVNNFFTGRETLQRENQSLKAQALLLQHKVLRLAALSAENTRLRELLNSSALLDQRVIVAELVGVAPDSSAHQIILGKGTNSGVFVGQPVVDAEGLVGQVIEAGSGSSRALLITDNTHSVPVLVNRSGLRAILAGTDHVNELELLHIPDTTDIRVGDLLVTSGLGQRFPAGYPVAFVSAVEHDPGQSFARIKATPTASLSKAQHFLLVFSPERLLSESSGPGNAAVTQRAQEAGVNGR